LAKKSSQRFESVGWIFWSVWFFVLLGPGLYGAWKLTNDDAHIFLRLGGGGCGAALGAGLIAWTVNSLLQWRVKRQRQTERKKAKKGKAK
jgi:hypothetical protein